MPNFKQAIINHNKRQNEDKPTHEKICNCRNREECPLDGKCLRECIVYKATVTETESNNKETYINTFKTRYNLHKSSSEPEHKKISYRIKRTFLGIIKQHRVQNRMGNGKKKVRPVTADKK